MKKEKNKKKYKVTFQIYHFLHFFFGGGGGWEKLKFSFVPNGQNVALYLINFILLIFV